MTKNKIILYSLLALIILNTVFIVYLANLRYYVFNENYYKQQFEKNNVYATLPQADNALNNLFLFFNDKGNLNDFFSGNERAHLQDVKVLINKFIIIFYFSIILEILLIIILYYLGKKGFKKNIGFVLLSSAGLILLISAIIYVSSNQFQAIFIKFHEIFFPQGNWTFSANSNLIRLFPQTFFYSFFYKIMLNSAIISMLFLPLIYYCFSRKNKLFLI